MEIETHLVDSQGAYDVPWLLQSFCWHVLGHRPPLLGSFSTRLLEEVRSYEPDSILTTGIAPVKKSALKEIGSMEVQRLNYSTDDPWNPNHKAKWFLEALPHYDLVFTPRHANEAEFRRSGCRVAYVPFGYDPSLFGPVSLTDDERERLHAEVVFVGNGDDDRVRYVTPLIEAGIDVALYGRYWDTYSATKSSARGYGSPETISKATAAADIALCLVRHANRDGHVMRSLEIPAIGACMLVEDTAEHRALFGPDGENVRYFQDPGSLVQRAQELLQQDDQREQLARRVHHHIVEEGEHTYQDRFREMMSTLEEL